MATTPSLCPYQEPHLTRSTICITSQALPRPFPLATATLLPRRLQIACNSTNSPQGGEKEDGLKGALSGMVGRQVEELLSKEENRVLLDGLEKASERVEIARRELAEIERQELEAKQLRDYVNLLEARASEIAECQKEISDARAMVEEAERSLLVSPVKSGNTSASVEVSRDEERLQSIKAATISALVGTLTALPIYSAQANSNLQLILPSAVTFISCALFGVMFRYAIRRDLDNFQLKTGTAAAFGFVKGLGTLLGGPELELNPGSFLSHALDGGLYVAENVLIFAFAAVSLDFCFKTGILSPFPTKQSASNADVDQTYPC